MSDDLSGALAFARWVVEHTSTRTEPWAFGTAYFNDDFPARYDANLVKVERPLEGVAVEALAAEADRALKGLRHRKVEVDDDSAGARIAMGLAELGYTGDHSVVMALRREPDHAGDLARVEEVSFEEIRPHLVELGLREPWGAEPGIAEILADFRKVLVDRIGARFFVARAPGGGEIASSCELFVHAGAAQVESVGTLEEHRGQGLARACVLRAVAEARDAGAGDVFIWADANDWPQKLYERLGFDPVGRVWSFLREPLPASGGVGVGSQRMTEGAANAQIVVDMYAPQASDYDEIWAPLLRPYGVRLLERLDLSEGRRLLDLGCGVGRLLSEIAERAPGSTVIGTDLVEAMLRCAPARFPRVAMDCTRPAFAPATFDAVVSTFMLFHVPDPPSALRCVHDVLRPGGGVGIAVWGTGDDMPALEVWTEELDACGARPDPAADGPPDGEEQVNSPEKLGGLLSGAGFTDVQVEIAPWEQRWDLDSFMEWRTRMSVSRRRLATLDPSVRMACIARVRERVAPMASEGLVDRDEVILATARKPG